MKQAQTVIKHVDRLSPIIFLTLAIVTVVSIFSYIVLVNKAVLNAVAKEKAEQEIASLSSSLSEKEFEYISAKGQVTMDLAYAKGFVSASNKTSFATLAKPAQNVAVR